MRKYILSLALGSSCRGGVGGYLCTHTHVHEPRRGAECREQSPFEFSRKTQCSFLSPLHLQSCQYFLSIRYDTPARIRSRAQRSCVHTAPAEPGGRILHLRHLTNRLHDKVLSVIHRTAHHSSVEMIRALLTDPPGHQITNIRVKRERRTGSLWKSDRLKK